MTEPTLTKENWRKVSKKNALFRVSVIFCLMFVITFMIGNITERNQIFLSNVAFGESPIATPMASENQINIPSPPPERSLADKASSAFQSNDELTVQAVLGAKRQIVIASGIESKITKFKLESGDKFKKGQVLVEYDCSVDHGRLNESLSRQRVTEQQLIAYQKLSQMDSVSNIELVIAHENNEQNKAIISQIKGRLKSCKHVAPWDGRVIRKMASQYEYVQSGRVIMEIASHEPLRAEFLVPSSWLRWLNVKTPLEIYINETGKTYTAKINNVFGEVDPVSQSIQVVAEMEKYHEELLPGMSGRATFTNATIEQGKDNGFLGLKLSENRTK